MDVAARNKLYRDQTLTAMPRLLTELDREVFSFTFGSFDREYWAWATKDFSNVDLQRGVYALAILYLTPFEGNLWHARPRVKDWILGAIEFWRRSQYSNGSHNHHYPNEYSFVGAAFPLYELSEAFRMLDGAGEITGDQKGAWLEGMARAGRFLCDVSELHGFISNHRIGAACGLQSLFQLTGDSAYKERAEALVRGVSAAASKSEGWLLEYGGADPGYQTLDTYYMANYGRLTGDRQFEREVIEPAIRFLQYFFHPDGSVGGEYGSRNCSLYFPAGFEILAARMPEAEAIASHAAEAIRNANTPALPAMDIRNFVPMLSSYAQSILWTGIARTVTSAELPFKREFERYWPQAGLFVRSDSLHYTILGCSKGGVMKIYDKGSGRLLDSSAGYVARLDDGKVVSNQFLHAGVYEGMDDCQGIEAAIRPDRTIKMRQPFFYVIRDRTQSQLKFLLFRMFTFTVGRNLWLANWVKRKIITGLFINRRKEAALTLEREFTFSSASPVIRDRFSGRSLDQIKSLRMGDIFTTIYMASSKYYRHQETISDLQSKIELKERLIAGHNRLSFQLGNGSGVVQSGEIKRQRHDAPDSPHDLPD